MAGKHFSFLLRKKTDPDFVNAFSDFSPPQALVATWLCRLLEIPGVALDEDFFDCLHWCCNGLQTVALHVQNLAQGIKGRTLSVSRAKKVLRGLSDVNEKHLSHELAELVEEFPDLTPALKNSIADYLREMTAQSREEIWFSHGIQRFFGLDDDAMSICTYAFMASNYRQITNYFENCLDVEEYSNRRIFAHILGLDSARCRELIEQLTAMGILDEDVELRLSGSVERAWKNGNEQNLQQSFCQPVTGCSLPLSEFSLPEEDKEHVLALLRHSDHRPLHILLYGAAGSGKTTFARSLAHALKVKAWTVPCNESESTQERRLALTACLRLASQHAGAFVLVDEAEQILDTRTEIFNDGVSDKAWLNNFMEQKGQRIIWIVNQVFHLDQAVRRRFTYSIHFATPGVRERQKMWRRVLNRLHAVKRIPEAELDLLARRYPVQPAIMEEAVVQAKALASRKNFVQYVEQVLKAHLLLQNDGQMPRLAENNDVHYSLEGVCTEKPITEMLDKWRKINVRLRDNPGLLCPGMATMLFYGPPGTGKTALAKYLANILERECLIKRASNLLGPYVGETEQNIAAAFEEAEQNDSILVIDEVDTFLYNRGKTQHNWENTMVNEFLVSLEECRGFCICTTNLRKDMDAAAMRRFSFKVAFTYASTQHLQALYKSMLVPLAGCEPEASILEELYRHKNLTPGDFHAVRMQFWLEEPGSVKHDVLLKALLQEERTKLETTAKSIGFSH